MYHTHRVFLPHYFSSSQSCQILGLFLNTHLSPSEKNTLITASSALHLKFINGFRYVLILTAPCIWFGSKTPTLSSRCLGHIFYVLKWEASSAYSVLPSFLYLTCGKPQNTGWNIKKLLQQGCCGLVSPSKSTFNWSSSFILLLGVIIFRTILDTLQPALDFSLCQSNELITSPVFRTAALHRNLNIICTFLLKLSLKLNTFFIMGSGK